jgi:hypothetical protein
LLKKAVYIAGAVGCALIVTEVATQVLSEMSCCEGTDPAVNPESYRTLVSSTININILKVHPVGADIVTVPAATKTSRVHRLAVGIAGACLVALIGIEVAEDVI